MNLLGRFKNFTTGTPRRTLISSVIIALLIPATLLANAQRWELRKEAAETPTPLVEAGEWGSFVTVEFFQGLVGVSKEEEEARVAVAIQEKFGALKQYRLPEGLKELGFPDLYDFIIIYTQDGVPIRPDLDALTDISQIGHEDNNLTFTFNSPDNPWTPEEESALRQHLESAYPIMKEIAGPPAFDITVNVRKGVECSEGIGGYYNVARDVITICPDTRGLPSQLAIEKYKGVATHEMGHAFHDDANCVFDEGFAESMSTEVDTRLGTFGEPNRYHVLNMWHENQNKETLSPWHGIFHSSSIPLQRALRYLSAGFMFSKMYIEYDDFFRSFHQEYYYEFYDDPSIARNRDRLKDIMKSSAPTVEGTAFDEWFLKQHVYGSYQGDPARLYSFFVGLGNISAVVTIVTSYGDWPGPGEYPLPDLEINFICETLFSKERICEGTMVTNEDGTAYHVFPLDFFPKEPFKISLTANGLEDETYGVVPGGIGLFGIAPESSGTATATYGGQEATANVSSGKFSLLEPLLFRGRVDLRFEGEKIFEKSVTKDSSPYFVHLACIPESTIPGDLDCDCRVTVADIMKVAAIWNAEEGDERFKPEFDFDDDGRITVVDIMYIAAKWGDVCEE